MCFSVIFQALEQDARTAVIRSFGRLPSQEKEPESYHLFCRYCAEGSSVVKLKELRGLAYEVSWLALLVCVWARVCRGRGGLYPCV